MDTSRVLVGLGLRISSLIPSKTEERDSVQSPSKDNSHGTVIALLSL
jgi:hypothetical protein